MEPDLSLLEWGFIERQGAENPGGDISEWSHQHEIAFSLIQIQIIYRNIYRSVYIYGLVYTNIEFLALPDERTQKQQHHYQQPHPTPSI